MGAIYFQRVARAELDYARRNLKPRDARSYVEMTAAALGSNHSYSSQLLHGSDYWRTVLDGACGIDIYGHNGVSVGDIEATDSTISTFASPEDYRTVSTAIAATAHSRTSPKLPV